MAFASVATQQQLKSKWHFSACWGRLQEGVEVLLLETRKAVPVG